MLLRGSEYQVMRPIFVASELALPWEKIAKKMSVADLDTRPLSRGEEKRCRVEVVVVVGGREGRDTNKSCGDILGTSLVLLWYFPLSQGLSSSSAPFSTFHTFPRPSPNRLEGPALERSDRPS